MYAVVGHLRHALRTVKGFILYAVFEGYNYGVFFKVYSRRVLYAVVDVHLQRVLYAVVDSHLRHALCAVKWFILYVVFEGHIYGVFFNVYSRRVLYAVIDVRRL